jgi:hypothetical protein
MNKPQLTHRVAPELVRDALSLFRSRSLTAEQTAERLGLSRSGMYKLYARYLRAAAEGRASSFSPGASGGDHAPDWPPGVADALRRRLTASPSYSYASAASEALRLHGFRLGRAQVRHWAIREGIAQRPRDAPLSYTRRWQRDRVGELSQMDATPYRWFGPDGAMMPMINMLDDCSRFQTGGRIYARECHAAYLHFLESAFRTHGLPLQIYVDHATAFFSGTPGAVTRLQGDLLFYGVTFLYAPTPQAKGKIERVHQVWLDRLPALFALNGVRSLELAAEHTGALVYQRNHHEAHREIGSTPADAWRLAEREGRVCLRPVPKCPWWDFVWSERTRVRVGPDRRVDAGRVRVRVSARPGAWVVRCEHTDGHLSVIARPPEKGALPQILFTNRPK